MKFSKFMLVVIFTLVPMLSATAHAQDEEPFTVGYMIFFGSDIFVADMAELGYVDGENITYLLPDFSDVDFTIPEQFIAAFNREVQVMLDADVDLFVVNTDTDAVNLKPLVGETPIVFNLSDDPIATGAVTDLVNPGGNSTGSVTNRAHERRLQLMTEIKPDTDKVYYLYSTMTGEAETVLGQVQAVGEELNVEVVPAPITDLASSLEALDNVPEGTDWLFLTPYVPFDFAFSAKLMEVSIATGAGIGGVTDIPIPGYVLGYGPSLDASIGQAAAQVDRVVRGANAGELPIQTAENFLTINLEAAEAINMEIPEGILRQANTIVRPGDFQLTPTAPAPQ